MAETLFQKVWNAHAVRTLPTGQTQLFVGLHLVHEVTTPQAFDMLRQHGWRVAFPERTFATVDHIVPTRTQQRPFLDAMAEEMTVHLVRNCRDAGIPLWALDAANQGIVHVIGPELGLTQPGMTIACGDSHTSTHGALGAIAFGIGTSQVRDVLASQCLALDPLKVRRIDVNGRLGPGVYAKDVILTIIRRLGVHGGVGFAYEYGGSALDASRAPASTSPSSGRARMAGCQTWKPPHGSCAAVVSHLTSRRWSSPGPRRSGRPPRRAACTRCSSMPASNGAVPAARCASA